MSSARRPAGKPAGYGRTANRKTTSSKATSGRAAVSQTTVGKRMTRKAVAGKFSMSQVATRKVVPGKATVADNASSRSSKTIVYTTGLLRRNPDTHYALVDLVNLGTTIAKRMTVQVFDWSSGLPVALELTPCQTTKCLVSLAPGTSDFVYADVSGVAFKYEVRIARHAANANVVLNVSGLSDEPMTPQVGNNVLQLGLFRIKHGSVRKHAHNRKRGGC